ncbi:stage V sporulation protein AB [Neobacillus sp. MER 74]|uniref:stage V sporulation protein AB n=1 Tax=Bacillaceae TaxID=186817 RepID=UPI000BF67267|nr:MULTISPECIES: stage V sporulation protein AB [Bacillaceae]MCM3114693.1 stage V sporulation protein AB [Neobacillus sp. MER 74]PFP27356.1 stage V sporulation protein AB [Bacillus sp. AFS073361]
MTIKIIAILFLGVASGLAVGSGFVAFLTVLGIIPRLTQLSKTMKMIQHYEWAVVLGALAGVGASLRDPILHIPSFSLIFLGITGGIFYGMLAAALTEVLNVLPILAKRIRLDGEIVILIMAIVLGKIAGSIFQWVYFVHH